MATTDIADIEQRIEAAQERADEAARAYERVKHLAYDQDAEQRATASQARERMRAAGHAVDVLVSERRYALRAQVTAAERETAIVAANEAHAAAERDAEKDLGMLGLQLAESAAKVARTNAAAMKALGQAFDAAKAHDDLVRGTAKQLRAQDLVVENEKLGLRWETGAAVNDVLYIGGRVWLPVSTGAACMRAMWGAMRSRFGGQHLLTQRLDRWSGVSALETRPDELLKDAPLPPPFQPPTPPPMRSTWLPRAEVAPRSPGNDDKGGYYDHNGKKIG